MCRLLPGLIPGPRPPRQEGKGHTEGCVSTCRRALPHQLGNTAGRRRPGARRRWKFWHWSHTRVTGTEAAGNRMLRASPEAVEKEQPESPPGGSCSQTVSPGNFHTPARGQVINTWSLAPSRGLWETQPFPGPSPYMPPFLPGLPKLLPGKLLLPQSLRLSSQPPSPPYLLVDKSGGTGIPLV